MCWLLKQQFMFQNNDKQGIYKKGNVILKRVKGL